MSGGVAQQQRQGLIIAIDGPSGAGKSSISRLLAKRLGYLYVDTGAMYRAIALAVKRAAVSPDDDDKVVEICRKADITFFRTDGCCHVFLDGEDVSSEIRTPEISMQTSKISAKKTIRDILVDHQRQIGKNGGVVVEGRDIGTVVFPEADVKFFLSASARERGLRRYLELKAKGADISLEQTIAEVEQRDEQDARREHAPLCRAKDATVIDSTTLSIEEVVALMETFIRGKF